MGQTAKSVLFWYIVPYFKGNKLICSLHSFGFRNKKYMEKWFSIGIEEGLPQWLDRPETQWAQWVYAIWQLIRCNPATVLVLSYLPFKLSQWWRKKEAQVVVLGDTREYTLSAEAVYQIQREGPTGLKNIEYISRHKDDVNYPYQPYYYTVKHNKYFYFMHVAALHELTALAQHFPEQDIIFVDSLQKISGSVAVGKRLSETEAYEKLFSRSCGCGNGADLVVPTTLNYVDFSSKFWVVISSLPILLQANKCVKLSTLLSLVIIVLDVNRGRLYRLYDRNFNAIATYVKLKFFKTSTSLYDFFSIFSSRWEYIDTVKKHAYVAKPGDTLKVGIINKLEKHDDIEIVQWEKFQHESTNQNICMELDVHKAHCHLMKYGETYPTVKLNRRVYVL